MTRRTFLQSAAGAAALPLVQAAAPSTAGERMAAFPYGAVALLPGPMQRQFDQNHAFFLQLSEDRLLKIYRERTGLPAPGEYMGGWYENFCPGAHFGQYLSALARFSAATNSQPTRDKVGRLVQGYAQTVDPSGKFFVDLRYPAYTYDKLVIGLLDAHSCSGTPSAVSVLERTTRAAAPHMPDHALTDEEKQTRPHKDETYLWDESYTLAENLFIASERLDDRRYFDMGKRYLLDRTFFDPLSRGENVLPHLHAYSHMNALSSGMQGYLKLNDPKYLAAVNNAVEMIWQDQSYATGGWGPNEGFVEPHKGKLGASLDGTHRSFETPCGAYAHFKLMRYLLTLTGDPRYGDSMERVLYNTVLGAKPIQEDGRSFYYSDFGHNGFKTYKRDILTSAYPWDHDGRWPCCSGTLPQIAADYVISGYFRSQDGVAVNLYAPSRLRWVQNGTRCAIEQQTAYPHDSLVRLTLTAAAPREFNLRLRIPAWAGPQTYVAVNGKRVSQPLTPGRFLSLSRTWKSGDLVELELDQPLRTEAVDRQTPDQVAVVRGPQVLFAIAEGQPQLSRTDVARLQIEAAGADWRWSTSAGAITLRPFSVIQDERYQTYSRIMS